VLTGRPKENALRYRALISLLATGLRADVIPARQMEGRFHGFLQLRDTDDKVLASGDLVQWPQANQVTAELTFHFKDGSMHRETAVFSQRRVFRLLTYHLVQKGPSFKRPTEMTIKTSTGQVTIRYTEGGKEQAIDEQMKLPPDLANGIVTTLLGDIDPKVPKTTVSMLISTPKPRLVRLEISPEGEGPWPETGVTFKAIKYVVKVAIGGVAGVVAPIVGKQPPGTHVWMIGPKVPGFVKSEGPLFDGGPIWRIELANPIPRKSS